MQKSAASYLLGALVLFGSFAVATPAHAALTSDQVNAIIVLLAVFDADPSVIANVRATLANGQTVNMSSLAFAAGTQPDIADVVGGMQKVPFTNLVLKNNTSAPATVQSVTVELVGHAPDTYFDSLVLLDALGAQVGSPATIHNGQADLGGGLTLMPGQSTMVTVAGNIAPRISFTQNAQLQVVAINASVPVSGNLPVSGSSRTIKRTQ